MKRAIESTKENFFLEALKTFPLEPTTFSITFNAHGIPCSTEADKEAVEADYLSLCRSNRVIPYSLLELESTTNGTFEPSFSSIRSLSHDKYGKTVEDIVNGLLRRDKFYRIIFEQKHGCGGLRKLQAEYLWNLEKEGYKLGGASLYFGEFDPTPHGSVQMVQWHLELPYRIQIEFKEDAWPEQIVEITSWTNRLKEGLI